MRQAWFSSALMFVVWTLGCSESGNIQKASRQGTQGDISQAAGDTAQPSRDRAQVGETASSRGSIATEAVVDSTGGADRSVGIKGGRPGRIVHRDSMVSPRDLHGLGLADDIRELRLDHGLFAQAGLVFIVKQCPHLQHLRLRLCSLDDEAAGWIAELSNLQVLNLPQAEIGPQGLKKLVKLSELKLLRLGASKLDDSAIDILLDLKQLESLHLIGPRFSATGLARLIKNSQLSSLYIDDCSAAGQAPHDLAMLNPKLHFHVDQLHRDRIAAAGP